MPESIGMQPLPSAISVVLDALRTRGVEHLDLPMTAPRVWQALRAAKP